MALLTSTELVVLTPVDCKILDKPKPKAALECGRHSYSRCSNLLNNTPHTEESKTYTTNTSKTHTHTHTHKHPRTRTSTHTYAQSENINTTKTDKIYCLLIQKHSETETN
jgi:hypothetical protein